GSTSAPTATIVPAPSWLGTTSGKAAGRPGLSPRRDFQSVGFTPDTATRTRTSPSPSVGSGRSTSFNTSGPPVSVYTIALTGGDGSVATGDRTTRVGDRKWGATTSERTTNG